jgi:hypothetical protein
MKRNSKSSGFGIEGKPTERVGTFNRRILRDQNLIGKITYAIVVGIGILLTGCDQMGNIGKVKSGILTDVSRSITVGEALDNYKYFKKTGWKEFKTDNGITVVEFNAEYYKGGNSVRIQFLMNSGGRRGVDGNRFEVGYICTIHNGQVYETGTSSLGFRKGWASIYGQTEFFSDNGSRIRWIQ